MEKDLDEEKYRSRSKNANIKAVAQDILKTCKSESFEELMTRISSIDKSMSEHIKIIYPMLKGILEDPSFKHVKDLKYSSVSILKEAAITFHRAEGKVSVGLIDYLATIKCPKLYKKNIKDVDLVKNYGEGIKLYRESIKAPWPVEDRDFSLLHLTHFDSGGNVYYMRTSFQTPQIPTVKKHTRAEQHVFYNIYFTQH